MHLDQVRLVGGIRPCAEPGFEFASDRSGNFAIISAAGACRWCWRSGWRSTSSTIASTQERRCSRRSIRPCWRSLARARTSATKRRRRSPSTFLDANFDPNAHQVQGRPRTAREFSVKAETNAGLAFGSLFGYQDWPVAGRGHGRHRLCLLRDRAGARHDRLDEGRQAVVDEGRRARPHRHDVGCRSTTRTS